MAKLILLVGAVLIGGRLFHAWSTGPVPVEIHYLLGQPPVAAGVEVLVTREGGGPALARFESRLPGGELTQKTRLPAGREVLDITLVSADGARHTVQRTIEARRGAVVRIDLSREGS